MNITIDGDIISIINPYYTKPTISSDLEDKLVTVLNGMLY